MAPQLPYIAKIKTPGFIRTLDGKLEGKCVYGSFSTSGENVRMWILYGIQLFLLFLAVVIGATIETAVPVTLGSSYDAANYVRYIGGPAGMLAAVLGAIGMYIRKQILMMFVIVLDVISILFMLLAWILDSYGATNLSSLAQIPTPATQTPIPYSTAQSRAAAAAIFGAFGWALTIFVFYLSYAVYQEMLGGSGPPPTSFRATKTPKTKQPQQTQQATSNQPVVTEVSPKQSPVGPSARGAAPKANNQGGKSHNCPQCSTEWPVDVKFCGECGSQIPDAPQVTQSAEKSAPPPTGQWEEHFTDDGFMYYYNPKTGESKWAES